MSTSVRKLYPAEARAAVDTLNLLRLDMLKLRKGVIFHMDASTGYTGDAAVADGYGTSSSEVINALKVAYNVHIASVCSATTGIGAHVSVDATAISTADATNVASAITLSDDFKSKFNTHIGSAVFHPVADSTNTIVLSNDASEAALVLLVNQCVSKFNSHLAAAFNSQALVLTDP